MSGKRRGITEEVKILQGTESRRNYGRRCRRLCGRRLLLAITNHPNEVFGIGVVQFGRQGTLPTWAWARTVVSLLQLVVPIFNWVQSKLNGRQGNKNPTAAPPINKNHALQQSHNEEFSDWPHGLLAIGTFGNNPVIASKDSTHEIEQCEPEVQEKPSSSLEDQEIDFTPEEIGKLRKELTKLLSRKPAGESGRLGAGINLPLDKFLNCPSSLEVDRKINGDSNDHSSTVDELLQRSVSVVGSKSKELGPGDHSKAITKKSLTFLLKKMFVCSSGFTPAPAPSLRDPIPESRIEKLLRTIINKKMHSRGSAAPSAKKYLENVHGNLRDEDPKEEYDERPKEKVVSDGFKWVKTDDEFIVLEI